MGDELLKAIRTSIRLSIIEVTAYRTTAQEMIEINYLGVGDM